jgi:hypothetical protein
MAEPTLISLQTLGFQSVPMPALTDHQTKLFYAAVKSLNDACMKAAKKLQGSPNILIEIGIAVSGFIPGMELATGAAAEGPETHNLVLEQWKNGCFKKIAFWNGRKPTTTHLDELKDWIDKGLECYGQVPYGKQGVTREQVRRLLLDAQLTASTIITTIQPA